MPKNDHVDVKAQPSIFIWLAYHITEPVSMRAMERTAPPPYSEF